MVDKMRIQVSNLGGCILGIQRIILIFFLAVAKKKFARGKKKLKLCVVFLIYGLLYWKQVYVYRFLIQEAAYLFQCRRPYIRNTTHNFIFFRLRKTISSPIGVRVLVPNVGGRILGIQHIISTFFSPPENFFQDLQEFVFQEYNTHMCCIPSIRPPKLKVCEHILVSMQEAVYQEYNT